MEWPKAIASALGLNAEDSVESAVTAIKKLKGDVATTNNRAANPALDKFVPRADYDVALNQAKEANEKLTTKGDLTGESQSLTVSDLSPYMVHYHNTKSKKSHSVPISIDLYNQLFMILNKGIFLDSYSTFSHYLEKLNFNLPKGQRTHILRHTFASHFMMNGGNILTLQKVLGHSSLDMTMKYSHLAPDYLLCI